MPKNGLRSEPVSEMTMERFGNRDAVRLVRDGEVIGMLLRMCNDTWGIFDSREREVSSRRFPTAKAAFKAATPTGHSEGGSR
jgi:hypothetical protein